MRKLLIIVVSALVLAAAYFWFSPGKQFDLPQTDREFLPDYIAETLTLRIYDEQGFLADQLDAKRLEHFEQLGFTQFSAPRYTLFNNEHLAAWEISSLEGLWFPDDKIILEQNVLVRNLLPEQMIEQLSTHSLQLLLPEKTLHTHDKVRIIGPGFYILARGMQADLNQHLLKLHQHLETVYFNEN